MGERSELYYIRRKDIKKASGLLQSAEFEELLEQQLVSMKNEKNYFELYIVFTSPKYTDKLLCAEDMIGEANE